MWNNLNKFYWIWGGYCGFRRYRIKENINYYYEIFNERQATSENHSEDLYEEIFKTAIKMRVSDIHIEPQSDGVNVRFRYNGDLKIFKKI